MSNPIDNNQRFTLIFSIIATAIVVGLLAAGLGMLRGKKYGRIEGKKDGEKQGIIQGKALGLKEGVELGKKNGYNEGYRIGKSQNPKIESEVLKEAFSGARILFADEILRKKVDYEKTVSKLALLHDVTLVRSEIKELADETNIAVLSHLAEVGELSDKETKQIIINYKKRSSSITEEMARRYAEKIKYNDTRKKDLRSVVERTAAYTNAYSEILCDLILLLTPHAKHVIAKRMLQLSNKFINTKLSQTEKVGFIIDGMCQILAEVSINSLAKLYHDAATIIEFSSEHLVYNDGIENVLKLVSAQVTTHSYRTVTFERPGLAVDPNYTVRCTGNVLAGVDLKKFYRIDIIRKAVSSNGRSTIKITVPVPEILSVYTDITPSSDNQYIATSLKDSEMDQLYREEKSIARIQAIDNNILEIAKENVQNAFEILYSPLLLNASDNYELEVEFVKSEPENKGMVILH